jgi:hypothetical protein
MERLVNAFAHPPPRIPHATTMNRVHQTIAARGMDAWEILFYALRVNLAPFGAVKETKDAWKSTRLGIVKTGTHVPSSPIAKREIVSPPPRCPVTMERTAQWTYAPLTQVFANIATSMDLVTMETHVPMPIPVRKVSAKVPP